MIRRRLMLVMLTSSLLAACQPVATRPGQSTAAPAPAGTLLFEDDFDSDALDRSKWMVVGPDLWVNNEQQAYIDSPDTIHILPAGSIAGAQGGVLAIQPKYQPGYRTPSGRTADFVSGRITTRGKFDFTYGTASARIKMPDAKGAWPAFWMLGNGEWPATGEIDIMEYVGEKDWISSALHGPGYSGDTPLVARHVFTNGSDVTDWHIYSVDWSPDEILFRIDGTPTYRVTRAMVERHGRWAFDNPKYLLLNFALGGAYPSGVNGIETPYSGLPQATVDRIRRGNIAMYVDWVRVEGTERKADR